MLKRKVASRKLKRVCTQCGCGFTKGDVYYVDRKVYVDDEVYAFEMTYCGRCNYTNERWSERFRNFMDSGECEHKLSEVVWLPIPGESHLLEPDHEECKICGKWF